MEIRSELISNRGDYFKLIKILRCCSLCSPVMNPLGYLFKFVCLCCCSVNQSCLTLCNPNDRSTPSLPVLRQLLEFVQTHVHRVSDAIQLLTISSSVVPFSSLLQSFPASGSFPMSWLFASYGQSMSL